MFRLTFDLSRVRYTCLVVHFNRLWLRKKIILQRSTFVNHDITFRVFDLSVERIIEENLSLTSMRSK